MNNECCNGGSGGCWEVGVACMCGLMLWLGGAPLKYWFLCELLHRNQYGAWESRAQIGTQKIDRQRGRDEALWGAWRGQAHYAWLVSFHATVPHLRWWLLCSELDLARIFILIWLWKICTYSYACRDLYFSTDGAKLSTLDVTSSDVSSHSHCHKSRLPPKLSPTITHQTHHHGVLPHSIACLT
jgi:hypothetical protein